MAIPLKSEAMQKEEEKKKAYEEGIFHIVAEALSNDLHVDLWETLRYFKRIKNF